MIGFLKKRFLINLRIFNIFFFLLGLVVISILLYNQYVYSKNIIVDCFIEKKKASTEKLKRNFIKVLGEGISHIIEKEKKINRAFFLKNAKIVLDNHFGVFKVNNIAHQDLLGEFIKNLRVNKYSIRVINNNKILLSNIYFDPKDLSFVRFYAYEYKNKFYINYIDSSIKKDLEQIIFISKSYVKNFKIYYLQNNNLYSLLDNMPLDKFLNDDTLRYLKKEDFYHVLNWQKDDLIIFTALKVAGNDFIVEIKYSLDGLKETLDDIFDNLIKNLLLTGLAFFVLYILIIRNMSTGLIKLSNAMKENRECKKCGSFIKELHDLAYYYNNLYKKLNDEVKKNKALLDLNKRFVVDTIHQIRTPIGVIMLNLDLLKMMVEDKEVDDIIEEIDAAVSMLSNSYEDLAYVSSNDTLDYKPAWINISELTEERVEFFRKIAKVSDKNLIANIEEDIEYFINKIEYERIVDNNISNAIKYSTGEDIFINLFRRDGYIILEIASYGAPIKNKKEIFEVNYREQLHKRGLGIGLNIVKTICEKYGIRYRTYYRNRQNIFEYVFPPVKKDEK